MFRMGLCGLLLRLSASSKPYTQNIDTPTWLVG